MGTLNCTVVSAADVVLPAIAQQTLNSNLFLSSAKILYFLFSVYVVEI